ncbi:kinesin-like protein KIFC3 [Acanthaster planci]|uniref:Kinesin-like protein KIFC3 n=1 Tax=Acanthaster planci TaxID=133434 RepID=A0A8B7Z5M0_ACAPL|nr:kinesin-like protein KIFC3 [Acanthaster planci]
MAYTHASKFVFNTPKTYQSPGVGSGPSKLRSPTPSRWDTMREELGLSDDDYLNSDSESGDENEANGYGQVSREDVEALRRELEEKDKQREDLILQVKNFRENAKKYRARCEKEQANKWQQIKIMKKTHESHLDEKRQLIRNLQDIIEEQEGRIYELESEIKGNSSPTPSAPNLSEHVQKLASSLDRLQTEMAGIREKQLAAEHQLVAMEQDHENEKRGIQEDMAQLRSELKDAQGMIQTLSNGDAIPSGTDNEKEIELLKMELLKYEDELRRAKAMQEEAAREQARRSEERIRSLQEEIKRYRDDLEAAKRAEERSARDQAARGDQELDALREELQRYEDELTSTRTSQEKMAHEQAEASRQDAAIIKKFELENSRLKDRILELEADVATKSKIMAETKASHKKQQQHLERAITEQAARLKEVELEFSELKGNPQVVEVVKTVTVESEEAKQALIASQGTNAQLRQQVSALRQSCEATEKQLKHSKTHVLALQERLKEQESQMAVLDQELQSVLERSAAEVSDARKQGEETARALSQRFTALQTKFAHLRPGLLTVAQEYQQLRSLCGQFPSMLKAAIAQAKEEIGKALADITEHNRELVQKYHREMALRKKYHNEIIDLKGSIRVFCRVRPIIKEDGAGALAKNAVSLDADDDALLYLQNKGRSTTFEVDKVFSAESTQEQVFHEVEPLVVSSIDGYNVCIFAYGQTGSGKTYTMEGPSSNPGINQRALQRLFQETEQRSDEWDYTISVSVMEIYNEQLRDLLSDDPQYKLEIKLHPDGSGLYVPGLCEVEVGSVEDVNEVFRRGKRNRATATTDMNEHSSRSHALLCVKIAGINKASGKRYIGKLNLVDLAGSERVSKSGSGADSARLKEAQNINKSLSSLGDVIFALRTKQGHIPYRNSKLTYLLQESLGGDSKTLMVVQISPVLKNVSESQCSLSFAQRVRAVELGAASKRTESAEVAALKDRLAQYEDGPSSGYHSSPTRSNRSTPTRTPRSNLRR